MDRTAQILPKCKVTTTQKGSRKKKTHEEYVAEVTIKNPNVEVVGVYVGAIIKILHRCKIDGYEWMAQPNNILTGYGCPKCANKVNLTPMEYIQDVNTINKNIEVIENFVNMRTSILHKCKICSYEWKAVPKSILLGKGCPKCTSSTKKSHWDYIDEVFLLNPNIEVIGTYVGAKTSILHKCLIHNTEWMAQPTNILYGKGCPDCAREKQSKNNIMSNEEYLKRLSIENPLIEAVERYVDAKTPILHHCITHDIYWNIRPDSALNKKSGCPQCAKDKFRIATTKTREQYVAELSVKNPDIELIGDYLGDKISTKHYCKIHHFYYDIRPSYALNGSGCPRCKESKGERQVRRWLDNNNIQYEFQYIFNDCRNINPLPFDFYLPELNMCIEYDGGQHYFPVNFSGKGIENATEQFKKIQQHDNIKNEYCKNNGIRLLRIPYYKNAEEELNNFLFI